MKHKILAAALLLAPFAHAETPAQLETEIKALQATITSQNATIAALQHQVTLIAQNPALKLGPFVRVNPDTELGVVGPNVTFFGCNVHVNSGTGATDDHGNSTGLGNLIIGADDDPVGSYNQDPLEPGYRTGCNNLVVGRWNRFEHQAFGGIVAGDENYLGGQCNTILGGANNFTDGNDNVVVGGDTNTSWGEFNVISGGQGGFIRPALGYEATASSISGGVANGLTGIGSSICNGQYNQVFGNYSVLLSGYHSYNTGDNQTWSKTITAPTPSGE